MAVGCAGGRQHLVGIRIAKLVAHTGVALLRPDHVDRRGGNLVFNALFQATAQRSVESLLHGRIGHRKNGVHHNSGLLKWLYETTISF